MAKRFRDTKLSREAWYRRLKPSFKCAWNFICDDCDEAGIWSIDSDAVAFHVGEEIDLIEFFDAVNKDKVRIQKLNSEKFWLQGFIEFQYGRLSKDCKPHIPVYKLLQKHGIDLNEVKMSEDIGKTHNVTEKQRKGILQQDEFICCYCGKEKEERNLVIDHVVARKRGGTDRINNLVACCIPCNSKKGDLSLSEFCEKYDLDFNLINERVHERLSQRVYDTLKEKDKEKDMDKEEENTFGKSENLLPVAETPKEPRRPKLGVTIEKETELKELYTNLITHVQQIKDVQEQKRELAQFVTEHKPKFIEPYCDLWNVSVKTYGISQVEIISDSRLKKFKTRIREPAFDLIKILSEIKISHYLQGKTTDWKVDWDWIMENDTNYLKILEGKYRNNTN